MEKQSAVLTAQADVDAAVLSVEPEVTGELHLDMVSLFPQETFKGRKNGLRADLAQTLADLHPRLYVSRAVVWHMETELIIFIAGKTQ